MQRQLKKCLNQVIAGCYIFPAVTVLTVGCGSPLQLSATTDAASVFFVVAALFAIARHFMAWCIHTGCTAYQIVVHSRMHHVTMSMVALAGPTSVGPVSDNAGTSTLVRAIASKCGSFCDSMIQCYRRLPPWLLPQPQNTQNPRSPNSVTTVAVSFIAHRWWYFICTSSIWTVMKKRCSCIFLTFFPTSTTILRL
ncbi:ash family protein [Salmonella enterica]|nr:ash family protein [Salmonella enterica]